MKGYAMLGIGRTGWIEKEKPQCGPKDALVRPVALAPCTSDVHTVWEGALGDRHDLILGHEGVGEVVEVGSLVRDFKPGDTVIVPAITPDWDSPEAQAGFAMHSGGMLGGWKFSNFKDGMFGEVFHVNDADGNLALLPDGVDPAEAVMLSDMVPTGFHGAELADVQYGDTVVVIGIGPVGLMAIAGAVLRGAGRLYAVGSRPATVAAALEYGATEVVNYRAGDIVEQILDFTRGKGVDKVIIAGGDVDTFAPGAVGYRGAAPHRQRQLPGVRRIYPHSPGGMGVRHGAQGHFGRVDARRPSAYGKAGFAAAIRPPGRVAAAHPSLHGV